MSESDIETGPLDSIEQARILMEIPEGCWRVLKALIEKDQKVMRTKMEKPSSPRDMDQYWKGAIVMGDQVIGYLDAAIKILNAAKKEDQV